MMDIKIKTTRDFLSKYNELQSKYGSKIASLNGFGDSQLDYTDFIDNFIQEDTVADASIDGNSNVGHKDIVSLINEMSKPHSKVLAFNKIYYEINKKYGFNTANEWLENEWDGHMYLHDAWSSSFLPYCFSGDTRILTDQGIKRLDSIVGEPIKVINKNHGWEDATVKNFGKQRLYEITLTRYGVDEKIKVTGNHLWFVRTSDGMKLLRTDEVKQGDKIPFNTTRTWVSIQPSPFGVAHGFYTGDGDKGSHSRVMFCGDKAALIPYFTPFKVSGDEHEYTIGGIPNYFKKLPPLNETKNYLYGWLSGYFAADGYVDTKGRCTIASVDIENLEHVRNVLCVLGMPVGKIRWQDRISNLTGEMGRIYTLTLSSEYLNDDFFIRPLHKERMLLNNNVDRKDRNWIVVSVEDTGTEDEVFCAVVPGSESFTLDNNILTHNCYAYDLEPLVNKGLFFIDQFNASPPKHLSTFIDFVSEFVSWTCNRSSGAVGLPNFLVYAYYFWKKDCEEGYYIKSPEYYRDQCFQEIIFRLNQPYLRSGIQSAFTNFSIFDKYYLLALFGDKKYPDGSMIIDYIDAIKQFQLDFMRVRIKIMETSNVFTFPVVSYSMIFKNHKFSDEEYAKECCRINMKYCDSNFFNSDTVTSLSNCCRLKSNIDDLGYFNSIGGTALRVGSVKVNTINLARLAYESGTEEEYIAKLTKAVVLCLKTLDCVRSIIIRNSEKGLLPNYNPDIIDIDTQYNTIGIIGLYEALQKFGYTEVDAFGNTSYTDNGLEFAKHILKTINEVKNEFAKGKNYMINVEQIPGERAAAILMQKDKMFFPDEKYELPLYGNQWIPLGIKTSLNTKIKLSAELDNACGGGSIAHINIDAPFNNFETAWKMLNYVADSGVSYFAFNTKISSCKNNHGYYGDVCPICGEPTYTTYQRIVGFLTPTTSYSKERKEEVALRTWMNEQEYLH